MPQQIPHKTTGDYVTAIYRTFPGSVTIRYIDYTWVDGDAIDFLAAAFLGSSKLWWKIMDINPDIPNPFEIEPGTIIRIPKV